MLLLNWKALLCFQKRIAKIFHLVWSYLSASVLHQLLLKIYWWLLFCTLMNAKIATSNDAKEFKCWFEVSLFSNFSPDKSIIYQLFLSYYSSIYLLLLKWFFTSRFSVFWKINWISHWIFLSLFPFDHGHNLNFVVIIDNPMCNTRINETRQENF